jgi:hypothetical protein
LFNKAFAVVAQGQPGALKISFEEQKMNLRMRTK